MCRIQQELSCKIQEKKAAEIQEDEDTDTEASLNESAEAEETSAEEQSSGDLGAEELWHCGRESVGTECTGLICKAPFSTAGLECEKKKKSKTCLQTCPFAQKTFAN